MIKLKNVKRQLATLLNQSKTQVKNGWEVLLMGIIRYIKKKIFRKRRVNNRYNLILYREFMHREFNPKGKESSSAVVRNNNVIVFSNAVPCNCCKCFPPYKNNATIKNKE